MKRICILLTVLAAGFAHGAFWNIGPSAIDLVARGQISTHTANLTNPHQVTAAQVGALDAGAISSFAGTGTVYKATLADYATVAARAERIQVGDDDYWQTVEDGELVVWTVSPDTNRVYIVSASEDFNGPDVGTVLAYRSQFEGIRYFSETPEGYEWEMTDDGGRYELYDVLDSKHWRTVSGLLPMTFPSTAGTDALGSCVIDYVPITNATRFLSPVAVTNAANYLLSQHTAAADPHTPTTVSKVYASDSPLLIIVTNQNQVIVNMDKNITVGRPDASGAQDGQTIRWRFTADGQNRTVFWPTNTIFRIPSSSNMVTNNVVAAGTTSIFATEYVESTGKWLIEAYVWGY